MTTDLTWSELLESAVTITRLRRELRRCLGPGPYRDQLEREIHQVCARRICLFEQLRVAMRAEIAAEGEAPKAPPVGAELPAKELVPS